MPHERYLINHEHRYRPATLARLCAQDLQRTRLSNASRTEAARAPTSAGRPWRRGFDGPRPDACDVLAWRHLLPILMSKNVTLPSLPGRRRHLIRPIQTRGRHCLKASGGSTQPAILLDRTGSLHFATGVLAKGGKVVVTGLIGGAYSTAVAMFPLKAMTIEGTTTGTLAEARELIDLARDKQMTPTPIAERPLNQASASPR